MEKVFIEGAIPPEFVANFISKHQSIIQVGAHAIFLGQVRADIVGDRMVSAVEYTAYKGMANQKFQEIRECAFSEFDINCMHIYHSLGKVYVGEISLFMFVSSPQRKIAFEALDFAVDEIKADIPVFGKELFEDGSYQWKVSI